MTYLRNLLAILLILGMGIGLFLMSVFTCAFQSCFDK